MKFDQYATSLKKIEPIVFYMIQNIYSGLPPYVYTVYRCSGT